MILANDIGVVDHAWLDAALLDDSCRGLRCRMVIGEHGGVLCDRISGRLMVPHDPDALPRIVETIATQAVLNTDPRNEEPLPLEDDSGRPARIVVLSLDAADRIRPARQDMVAPMSEDLPAPPENDHGKSLRRMWLHIAIAISFLVFAYLVAGQGTPGSFVFLFLAGLNAGYVSKVWEKSKRERIKTPVEKARHTHRLRELERRMRMPDGIA